MDEAISGVVGAVIGVDVHPVAVTLARVTYLETCEIPIDKLLSIYAAAGWVVVMPRCVNRVCRSMRRVS